MITYSHFHLECIFMVHTFLIMIFGLGIPNILYQVHNSYGQHLLNSDIGNSFQGIHITSGIFQLWRSEGIITQIHLKYGCSASLLGTILSLYASYFHMHISCFYNKFKCLSYHHLSLFFGLSSISWCGHLIHISLPL